jgi:glutamate racemase
LQRKFGELFQSSSKLDDNEVPGLQQPWAGIGQRLRRKFVSGGTDNMQQAKSHLGIADWGIGGLGIYRLLTSQLGKIPVTYFSDTGVTPYGKMSRRELISRLNTVLSFLSATGVTHLVLGCNSASTVLPFLNFETLKVEGVIKSAVDVTQKMQPERLALLGGRRTVLSGVYRREFAKRGIKITQRVAQPLSSFIESGDVASERLREECRTILSPLKNYSHVLLACTHYPAIIPILKDFVSNETVFIDPADELVSKIKHWKLPAGSVNNFLTTGEPEKMQLAAVNAFSIRIKAVERITI